MAKERADNACDLLRRLIRNAENTEESADTVAVLEHCLDLIQREASGHLLFTEVAVGETVYFNTFADNATKCLGMLPHQVERINIQYLVSSDDPFPLAVHDYEFGRTVFTSDPTCEKGTAGVKH